MKDVVAVRIIGWGSPVQRIKKFVRYGHFFASNLRQRSLAFTVDKVARIIASAPHRLFDHIEIETINRCNGVCSLSGEQAGRYPHLRCRPRPGRPVVTRRLDKGLAPGIRARRHARR